MLNKSAATAFMQTDEALVWSMLVVRAPWHAALSRGWPILLLVACTACLQLQVPSL